ncbi:rab9 effector protein with kelch motifs isoform X2 [Ascaphus truei]
MELLQVLEPEDTPKKLTWYALVPRGEGPSSRVGHTCMYVPPSDVSAKGKVLILGGADPSCCFSDAHIIDLDSHEWDVPDWEGLLPRYEHASFIPTSSPGSIWVFAGAEKSENRNCVQVLNPGSRAWTSPMVTGAAPSPRTYHTSSAAIGDKLYVFGGGGKGADPVIDLKLHVFDSANMTWTQPETSGEPPQPRHGHMIAAIGAKLFLHGGMAKDTFFSDMFCIDTDTMMWERLEAQGDVPPACAGHAAAAWERNVYIYGGMTATGVLDTMYRFDTKTHVWTQIKWDSPSPSARLDHTMCLLPWKIRTGLPTSEQLPVNDTGDWSECSAGHGGGEVQLCLIFGGMDTTGEVYSDCCVIMLDK